MNLFFGLTSDDAARLTPSGPAALNTGSNVLALDTFTGVDGTNLTAHAMDVGGSWVSVSNGFVLSGGQAAPSASGACLDVTDVGNAACTVQASVTVGAAGHNGGVVGRYQDANNFWLAWAHQVAGFVLYEMASGVLVQQASAAATVNANSTHTVLLSFSGTTITARMDGGNTLTFTSSDFQSATQYGLRTNGGTDQLFDNFQVTNP